jgi:hypothetical protein
MDPQHRELLERRFDVPSWYGSSRYGERTVSGFAITSPELAEWSLASTDVRPGERTRTRSMWRRGETRALLSLDLSECVSVTDAHDEVLERLADIESDRIERCEIPGDVAFCYDDTMVLFARANIVAQVRNGGREIVAVMPFARALDERILERVLSQDRGLER